MNEKQLLTVQIAEMQILSSTIRDLRHKMLEKFEDLEHLIHQNTIKINKIMAQQDQINDLISQIGTDITGISNDVAGISQEITDLKNQVAQGQDQSATIAALTDLESKTSAAKTALDNLVPAPTDTTPTDGGDESQA